MLRKYATPRDLSIYAGRGRIFHIEYLFYTTGERSSDWVVGKGRTQLRFFTNFFLPNWVILRYPKGVKNAGLGHLFIPIIISYNI